MIKERVRATYNTLPFKKIPPRLVIKMAKQSVFWLNAFPKQNGVSDTISPHTIITGQKLDYNCQCKFQFGEYVQTHEEHDNSMSPKTIGALALRPTGNAQGGYYFLSLSTGRVVNRTHATPLPMPNEVIDMVHRMVRQQKANPGIVFGDRRNNTIFDDWEDEDDDDDGSYQYESELDDDDDDHPDADNTSQDTKDDDKSYNSSNDSDYIPEEDDDESDHDSEDEYEDDDDDSQHENGRNVNNIHENNRDINTDEDDKSKDNESRDEDHVEDPREAAQDDVPTDDSVDEYKRTTSDEGEITGVQTESINSEAGKSTGVQDEDTPEVETVTEDANDHDQVEMDGDANAVDDETNTRYNLRANRKRSYEHKYGDDFHTELAVATTVGEQAGGYDGQPLATEQMSMKKGLKVFRNEGRVAVKKEMQQLHD